MSMLRLLPLIFAAAGLFIACDRREPGQPPVATAISNDSSQQVFQVKGTVLEVTPAEKSVRIKHEEIPGYMQAMTMPFEVKDTNELAGLDPGDSVAFRMIVTEKDAWIDQIRKLNRPGTTNALPTTGPLRMVREVEPLEIGDRLPEYRFTNQFARPISTAQFKGQAMAINFLFTRCPLPTFCPLTANNFAETQQKLKKFHPAITNWQLLTLSFDPEFDKPSILKAYGERYSYDSNHWTLATGDLIDITAIAEQFGQTFWHDETGSLSHNLRTAVMDASGRVQKIIVGNKWTSDELVTEMVEAARK